MPGTPLVTARSRTAPLESTRPSTTDRVQAARDRIVFDRLIRPDTAAMDAKAAATGGRIGAPVSAAAPPTADGIGWVKTFQFGWVLYRPDRGALAVYGAIGARWAEFGGVSGWLGWPATDETAAPAGPGRYTHFDHGSIYWGPASGAHEVHGAIRDAWASFGWEQGALGLPISDEEDVPGIAGARRSRFQGGELAWTPATGARLTRLYNVSGDSSGGTLHVQGLGGGGDVQAPQVQRHVVVNASMDITDDETFGSNEHAHAEGRDERWVDSWDPQGVMQLVGKCGGEVRVELAVTAAVRPDGSVRASVDVKFYEGTSEETNDLDGTRSEVHVIPVDGVVQVPIRANNDDEGGDFADISLVISNAGT